MESVDQEDAVLIDHSDVPAEVQTTGHSAQYEEASPGIGIRVHYDKGYYHASVTVKAESEYKEIVQHVLVICADCSGSMRHNGGYQGLSHAFAMVPSYAKSLEESAHNSNGIMAKVIFFNDDVYHPTTKESQEFTQISAWKPELVAHLIDQLQADGLTNIEAATAEGLRLLLPQHAEAVNDNAGNTTANSKQVMSLILMTDGIASEGNTDAAAVRSLLHKHRTDKPVYLHSIAMGNEPSSEWLKTYVGDDGLVGHAATLEHVGRAFKDVIGELNGVQAILSAKVVVSRNGKVVSERTHQLGVKTERKTASTFNITFDKPGMRIKAGDVITVTSMGKTETVEVQSGVPMVTLRSDLWKENDVSSTVGRIIDEVQELANCGSLQQAMELLKVACETPCPQAVHNRTLKAYRSLALQTAVHHNPPRWEQDDDPDSDDGGETFRSFGSAAHTCKKARHGQLSDLAVLSSLTSSQY